MGDFQSINEAERIARLKIPGVVWDNLMAHTEYGLSYHENLKAYKRIRLRPRAMTTVGEVDTGTTLLGECVEAPIGVSPTAYHRAYHSEGEIATARVRIADRSAAQTGSCYIVSSSTSTHLHRVGAASAGVKWAQTYLFDDRSKSMQMVRAAEESGFRALVVTSDVCCLPSTRPPGRHTRIVRSMYGSPMMDEIGFKLGGFSPISMVSTRGWDEVRWLSTVTKLPIVVKGVLTAEDAVLARDHGASAILVSNHGGRQLDSGIATLDALPEVVEAVGSDLQVYLDGGIRHGTDVLKALALGARAVFVGRPVIWGLTCGGAAGVEQILQLLRKEFMLDMALTGCRTLKDISPRILKRQPAKL